MKDKIQKHGSCQHANRGKTYSEAYGSIEADKDKIMEQGLKARIKGTKQKDSK